MYNFSKLPECVQTRRKERVKGIDLSKCRIIVQQKQITLPWYIYPLHKLFKCSSETSTFNRKWGLLHLRVNLCHFLPLMCMRSIQWDLNDSVHQEGLHPCVNASFCLFNVTSNQPVLQVTVPTH